MQWQPDKEISEAGGMQNYYKDLIATWLALPDFEVPLSSRIPKPRNLSSEFQSVLPCKPGVLLLPP